MKRILSIAIALAALLTGLVETAQADEVRWLRDYDEAVDAARRFQLPLLIYVTHPRCHFCRQMERETYANSGVTQRLNGRFVTLKIDAAEQPELAAKLQVTGFPATLITGPNLRVLDRADGFMQPASFTERLDAVTESP